jgi:hypothetical protein
MMPEVCQILVCQMKCVLPSLWTQKKRIITAFHPHEATYMVHNTWLQDPGLNLNTATCT